jgi:hypothetical protein
MRHLSLSIGALLAMGSLSCSGGEVTIEVDASFPESRRGAVLAAIRAWDDESSRGLRVEPGGEWLVIQAPLPVVGSAYTQRPRHLVRFDPARPEAIVFADAMHEVGHVLGLEHICRGAIALGKVSVERPCDPARSFGVMDPETISFELTDDDRAECRRVGC